MFSALYADCLRVYFVVFHIYDLHVLVILYWETAITVGIVWSRDGEPLPPVSSLAPLEISPDTLITGFNFIHILSCLIIQ
jgi:hypothetical protein